MGKKLTEEKKSLVIENLNLARWRVHKKWKNATYGLEQEDMMQMAYVGLMKAAMKYDPDRAKFSTYAIQKIDKEFIDYIQKQNRQKRDFDQIFFEDMLKSDDNSTEKDLNYCQDAFVNCEINYSQNLILQEHLKRLPLKMRYIIYLLLFKNYTQREIGEIFDVSYTTIQNWLDKYFKDRKWLFQNRKGSKIK